MTLKAQGRSITTQHMNHFNLYQTIYTCTVRTCITQSASMSDDPLIGVFQTINRHPITRTTVHVLLIIHCRHCIAIYSTLMTFANSVDPWHGTTKEPL